MVVIVVVLSLRRSPLHHPSSPTFNLNLSFDLRVGPRKNTGAQTAPRKTWVAKSKGATAAPPAPTNSIGAPPRRQWSLLHSHRKMPFQSAHSKPRCPPQRQLTLPRLRRRAPPPTAGRATRRPTFAPPYSKVVVRSNPLFAIRSYSTLLSCFTLIYSTLLHYTTLLLYNSTSLV